MTASSRSQKERCGLLRGHVAARHRRRRCHQRSTSSRRPCGWRGTSRRAVCLGSASPAQIRMATDSNTGNLTRITPARGLHTHETTFDRRLYSNPHLGGRMAVEPQVSKLDNGLSVVTTPVPTAQSVSVNIFVGVGSRNETPTHQRRLALHGAPALQGHGTPPRSHHHRRADRGRGRRAERLYLEGTDLLLEPGAVRQAGAGARRPRRHVPALAPGAGGDRPRAHRRPAGDPPRARPAGCVGLGVALEGDVRRPADRLADRRDAGDDRGNGARRLRRPRRHLLRAVQHRAQHRRQHHAR